MEAHANQIGTEPNFLMLLQILFCHFSKFLSEVGRLWEGSISFITELLNVQRVYAGQARPYPSESKWRARPFELIHTNTCTVDPGQLAAELSRSFFIIILFWKLLLCGSQRKMKLFQRILIQQERFTDCKLKVRRSDHVRWWRGEFLSKDFDHFLQWKWHSTSIDYIFHSKTKKNGVSWKDESENDFNG